MLSPILEAGESDSGVRGFGMVSIGIFPEVEEDPGLLGGLGGLPFFLVEFCQEIMVSGMDKIPVRLAWDECYPPFEIEHLADVLVTDLSGQFQLIAEPLDDLSLGGDLGLDGHSLADFGVEGLVDPAHALPAQFFNDLLGAGESRAGGQLFFGSFDGLGVGNWDVCVNAKLCPAVSAEFLGLRILCLTFRAFQRVFSP